MARSNSPRLTDWQWLFVIEALPAILGGEDEARTARERHSVGEALRDRRVLTFGLLYFCMVVNVYGLSFWVGEIVDNVPGLSEVGKGFVTAIPYTVGRCRPRSSAAPPRRRGSR